MLSLYIISYQLNCYLHLLYMLIVRYQSQVVLPVGNRKIENILVMAVVNWSIAVSLKLVDGVPNVISVASDMLCLCLTNWMWM